MSVSLMLRSARRHARISGAARFASTTTETALPSFSRALFGGSISSSSVYPFPQVLSEETKGTLGMLVEPVTKFFEEVNDAKKNDETGSVPAEVTQGLRDMGAFGLQVPEELGGIGLKNTGYARLVEVVGAHDLGVGIYLGAHQSIGYKGILLYGTDAQKSKYLPSLASGEKVAAFALTEPGAGSDAAGVKTRVTLSDDGKHYILNGAKIWISNGGIAEIFTVFAKMEVTDPKTGEKKDKMGAFIVERSFGGVTSGPPEKKMGIKCSNTAEVFFENVKVPVENILLQPGDGFKIAMGILNNGRFGMGAALTGTMKSLVQGVTEHVNQRVQFGKKLREYGVIKSKIASMTSRLYAAESLAYLLAANMDRGMTDYQIEAAASKIFASEAAWYCADEAIQIMGGLGFMKALPYERIQRDLRIFRIFEGANDILRQMVGLTGLQTVGKELEVVQKASKAPLANLSLLASFGLKMGKARVGMVDRPSLSWAPTSLRPAADVIEEATGALGVVAAEVIMKYGKSIMERQLVVERVADVVIDITAATAAASRAATAVANKLPSAEHEVAIANLFAEEAKERIQNNLKALRSGASRLDKLKYQVADEVMNAGKYFAAHPTGL